MKTLPSPKRLQANRRNARRSTGPRTAAGKQRSAQNAVRHRLSVPLPDDLLDPLRQQVAGLLLASSIPPENADALAETIIGHERVMAAFRKTAYERLRHDRAGRTAPAAARQPHLATLPLQNPAASGCSRSRAGLSMEERDRLQAAKDDADQARLFRPARRERPPKEPDLGRYLRRSWNQLIKSLRRIE